MSHLRVTLHSDETMKQKKKRKKLHSMTLSRTRVDSALGAGIAVIAFCPRNSSRPVHEAFARSAARLVALAIGEKGKLEGCSEDPVRAAESRALCTAWFLAGACCAHAQQAPRASSCTPRSKLSLYLNQRKERF